MLTDRFFKLTVLAVTAIPLAAAFSHHRSLGGLSAEQIDAIVPTLRVAPPENPPGPQNDTSTRLVDDADHPWMAAAPNDMRGPCPGLNTLASHGVSTLYHDDLEPIFTSVAVVLASKWNCYTRSDY